jgi:hypothetical protein
MLWLGPVAFAKRGVVAVAWRALGRKLKRRSDRNVRSVALKGTTGAIWLGRWTAAGPP